MNAFSFALISPNYTSRQVATIALLFLVMQHQHTVDFPVLQQQHFSKRCKTASACLRKSDTLIGEIPLSLMFLLISVAQFEIRLPCLKPCVHLKGADSHSGSQRLLVFVATEENKSALSDVIA